MKISGRQEKRKFLKEEEEEKEKKKQRAMSLGSPSYFSCCCNQISVKKQFKEERVCSGL